MYRLYIGAFRVLQVYGGGVGLEVHKIVGFTGLGHKFKVWDPTV